MPFRAFGVEVGLPELAAGVMACALNAYVLMGGADFGGGLWDLLARGPRRDAQRALVAEAIGPIWEANHVWLILVVVLLFTCFPPAFAQVATVLHVPLTLMLVGVVLRGSAFVFRAYAPAGAAGGAAGRRWGRVFAVASLVTPLLLGVCLGALASGAVGRVDVLRGSFAERFVRPWAAPFPWAVGALALALFAFLAAVYLTVEADDRAAGGPPADGAPARALAGDFRVRAVAAAAAVLACAAVALALAPADGTAGGGVRRVLTGGGWAVALQLLTAGCAVGAVTALVGRRWRLARFAAQGQASCIVWGWAWAQFPAVVPPAGTAAALAAPPRTLALSLGTLAAGTLVLLPSFVYLFRVFKGRPAGEAEHA